MCFVSPFRHHATGWAEVVDGKLQVNCSKAGLFNILAFGDRCDSGAMECDKPIEYEEVEETNDNVKTQSS